MRSILKEIKLSSVLLLLLGSATFLQNVRKFIGVGEK